MPEMDGFDFIRTVRRDPGLKQPAVVIVTSSVRAGDAAQCKDLEVAAYLSKPILKADLLTAVRTALGSQQGAAVNSPSVSPLMRKAGRALRILVAEDNAVNQAVILRVLAKMGHTALLAKHGKEALSMISNDKFDVVFMDVQMPEMDGFAATRAVREAEKIGGSHVPIYAMTAHAMKGDRELCLSAGMDGYLTKPLRLNEVEQVLANLAADRANPPATLVGTRAKAPAPPRASWNRMEAIDRLGGDEDLFLELCQIFLEESPKLLKELRTALNGGDAEAAMRAAHSLKGEVGYLSAPLAMSSARQLEEMARTGNLSGSEKVLAVLEQELDALSEDMRTTEVHS
jgi:CheY-like chemotaxis protein/HPt (histidine-containing phosphotransfer) domain-containing protein